MIHSLASILRSYRYPARTEALLQDAIEQVLRKHAVLFEREYILSREDRLDFYIACARVAIEVKIHGRSADVLRQLHRYAQHGDVDSILLVTTRMKHMELPSELEGKLVLVLYLGDSAL